jgi:alkylated DNA nucleotide flippase Atl1
VSPPPTTTVWAPRWNAASQVLRLGAHREDHGARPDLLAADVHDVHAAILGGEVELRGVVRDEACAEALRLVAQVLHHLRAQHALRVARVVLDVGRLLKQAAPGEALDHERLEVRARGVQRRGVARGAAADDDDVLDFLRFHAHYFTL